MSKDEAPRMHTAEHVLNGVMVARYGCGRCFSAHVNPKKSKCDYQFDHQLDDAEARAIEAEVNRVLSGNLTVTAVDMDRAEAAVRFDLGRLPDDAGDTLRIVRVGEFDACPCSGAHVRNTAEVGAFRLISHDFENGVLRLRFKLDAPAA
jgi:Ser-tRNA(Ala) deacylase AlaX